VTKAAIKPYDMGRQLWRAMPFALVLGLVVLLMAGSGAFASGRFTLDRGLLRAKLEQKYYEGLEAALGLIEEKSNEITDKWTEDGAYTLMAGFLHANPKAMAIFKAELRAGKSPKQALKTAVAKEGNGTPFSALSKVDKYVGPQVQAIYGDLKKVATRAKARLAALSAVADQAADIKDPAEFSKLLREYGLGGAGIDSFEVLEKRLSTVRNVLESPIGTYWGLFQTVYKGVEGKEPGGRASAMFTLMDETAGNLPILGEFVHLYMEMAKELLAATLRLKKKIAQWDMGCVGTGTHGVTIAQNARGVAFNYPGTACPEVDIKDLYVDFSNPELLYFWTGKAWLKAPSGIGGAPAIVRILAMLKAVAKVRPGTRADVPAAFGVFGIKGGFTKTQSAAETLYFDIQNRWKRLKQALANLDIPQARIIPILENRSGAGAGFDSYLDNHFSLDKNQILFVYRYVLSRMGNGAMIRKNLDILAKLGAFHPTVILGTLDIPEGLDLAGVTPVFDITAKQGILIEQQSISLGARKFRLVLFGDSGMRFGYQIGLGELRSKPLEVTNWNNMLIPQHAVFKAGLNVSLRLPKRVEIGQDIAVHGQIGAAAKPPFQLRWWVDGNPAGARTLNTPEFSIPQVFATAGLHDFEVSVTDKRGFEGGERTDIPVAFQLSSKTTSSPDKGGQRVVIIAVKGARGAYTVTWTSSDGQKFKTEQSRDRFFQRFADAGQSTLKWVDVSVFDHASRIEVPLRVNMGAAPPLQVTMRASPASITVGEGTTLAIGITGGKPDFDLAVYTDGRLVWNKSSRQRDNTATIIPGPPGVHEIRVVVRDQSGLRAQTTTKITVAKASKPDAVGAGAGAGVTPSPSAQPASNRSMSFLGDADFEDYTVLPVAPLDGDFTPSTDPADRILDGAMRNTRIEITIRGAAITGRFSGLEIVSGFKFRFDCMLSGKYSPDQSVLMDMACKRPDNPEINFTGLMSGKRDGRGLKGEWQFGGGMDGGKWRALPR